MDVTVTDKPVVLAVDDTPANLDILGTILRDDYKVKVARDGSKALDLAKREPKPDVILLDIMMPGLSGYEVCEQLKADPETSSIPVIFITAKTEIEDEQRGLALGAVDYITKPFHPDIVRARLSRHLASHQATRNLIDEIRDLRDNKLRSFAKIDESKLTALLREGEGHELEFKSTLRWNTHADRSDKDIEKACLKTVAGFLNTDGGILLIGVGDAGEPIGLDKDHFKSEDKLMSHWVDLLKSSLGTEFLRNIRSTVHTVCEQRVLMVECLPAKVPVFFNRDNDGSFYVRMSNTTQALMPREVLAYIEQYFTSGQRQENGSGGSHDDIVAADRSAPSSAGSDTNSSSDLQQPEFVTFFSWFNELQKRRVFRTAIFYIAIAWGFTEITTSIAQTLDAPPWLSRVLVLGFIGGFPLTLLLSWLYDLRLIREQSDFSSLTKKKVIWLTVVLLLISGTFISAYTYFGAT
jgi:putative two-component system response regulator